MVPAAPASIWVSCKRPPETRRGDRSCVGDRTTDAKRAFRGALEAYVDTNAAIDRRGRIPEHADRAERVSGSRSLGCGTRFGRSCAHGDGANRARKHDCAQDRRSHGYIVPSEAQELLKTPSCQRERAHTSPAAEGFGPDRSVRCMHAGPGRVSSTIRRATPGGATPPTAVRRSRISWVRFVFSRLGVAMRRRTSEHDGSRRSAASRQRGSRTAPETSRSASGQRGNRCRHGRRVRRRTRHSRHHDRRNRPA